MNPLAAIDLVLTILTNRAINLTEQERDDLASPASLDDMWYTIFPNDRKDQA